MAELQLQNGMVALFDDADAALVAKFKWKAIQKDRCWYATTGWLMMHRWFLGLVPKPGNPHRDTLVDHRNKNGLDNRRENLRIVTPSQSVYNRSGWANSLSRFKGVSIRRSPSTDRIWWTATIMAEGKRHSLGCFAIEEDAARAYDEAALRLHGEFAQINFPTNGMPTAAAVRNLALYSGSANNPNPSKSTGQRPDKAGAA